MQFGGQTPLKLARDLEATGVPIIGTSAGHRSTSPRTASASSSCCTELKLRQPPNRTARTEEEAMQLAAGDRLPGGGAAALRARRPRDGDRARAARPRALHARGGEGVERLARCCSTASSNDAIEVDVDCVCDGERRAHRRHHGAHRAGRRALRRLGLLAAAVLAVAARSQDELRRQTRAMAQGAATSSG